MALHFEWDEEKNRLNIAKHGFDLADACELFTGHAPLLARPCLAGHQDEERWIGIGVIGGLFVVVAVFTERGSETIRIISLRKANRQERNRYEEEIKNRRETR